MRKTNIVNLSLVLRNVNRKEKYYEKFKDKYFINYIRQYIIFDLYIFASSKTSSFGKFSSGLLVGLSIGCNLIGIILTTSYIANNKDK